MMATLNGASFAAARRPLLEDIQRLDDLVQLEQTQDLKPRLSKLMVDMLGESAAVT
jgi:hypothetical protein